MLDERFVGEFKIHSKEYEKLVSDAIEEYNANGKKTILFVCDTFFPTIDGVVMVMHNYAKLLFDKVNVVMLVPAFKGKVYAKGYLAIGVTSSYSKKLRNQVPLPMFDHHYGKLLKKLRIDLIHCHSPFTMGRVALRLHKKRKIPLVCTFHSLYKRDFKKQVPMFVSFMMHYIMRCFNNCTEVWTMQPACVEALREYGYKGPITIMPNGTSTEPSENYQLERAVARQNYDVDDDTTLFVFVGRLVTQKNIIFITDVLAGLKKRGLKFKMLFVGDGADRHLLEKHIEELGLSDCVFTVGQKDKEGVTEAFAAADMFLFPSFYDTSSLVQVEAASRYTPTAFVEKSTTSYTATDKVNGYILPNDVEAFAQGVYDAVSDKEKLREVGQNAYNDLYITWKQIVAKAIVRYNEIIENSNKDK